MNPAVTLREASATNDWVDLLIGDHQYVSGYVAEVIEGPDGLICAISSHKPDHFQLGGHVVGVPVWSIRAIHRREIR